MPEKKVRVVYYAPNLTKIKPYKHLQADGKTLGGRDEPGN